MEPVDQDVMVLALDAYRQYIIADYRKMYGEKDITSPFFDVSFMKGKKFIRVVTHSSGGSRSSHSFIETETGVIWKSASWKAPALNFPRGNVLDRTFERVTWTGAR